MRRGFRKAGSFLLALTLTLALALPAQAAGLRLTWEKGSGSGVALTLRGLGEESIYGMQLELTVAGSYSAASFTPTDPEGYAECRVSASNKSTRVVIYLTAQKPLNSGGTLPAGTLTLDKSFTMPGEVTVKLLDRELKALAAADGTVVSASEQGRGTSGSADRDDDDDDGPDTYRVRVSSTRHGQVKADKTRAEAREIVTLTVTAEEGYELSKLNVTAAGGREMDVTDVGGGKYTFRMPAGEVEITATFLEAGQDRPALPFTDVTEWDWYYSAVQYVYENGMMTGTSETTFSPDMETSRGMIVTVLHRMEGTPKAAEAGFSDVPREEYYAKAVDWAYETGVASGYGGNETGTFGPGDSITREQLAAILFRYAGKKGEDVTARGDLSAFADGGEISEYALDSMAWAVGVGLITGMGDGTIAPGGNATRAQVATILMRYCQNSMD